jgi:hypothetical protein
MESKWSFVGAGVLLIAGLIGILLFPNEVLLFNLPALELGVLAIILSAVLFGLEFRRRRSLPMEISQEDEDIIAIHIALDMMDGEINGNYFDNED